MDQQDLKTLERFRQQLRILEVLRDVRPAYFKEEKTRRNKRREQIPE